MKAPSKLLFGAVGLSMAAAALFMGAGSASADEICTTLCDPGDTPLPMLKIASIDQLESIERKAGGTQQDYIIVKLETILVTGP
jgi:hypothetical protein